MNKTPVVPRLNLRVFLCLPPFFAAGCGGQKLAAEPLSTRGGIATWYDVPDGSLPERRAPGEMTAASDKLPHGSSVRVTNLSNNRSVVVRITDDGVGRKSDVDLCKEAAEQLGMVEKGEVKVRIEHVEAKPAPK